MFGTPTYMGGPSWQFKKFADASSKAEVEQMYVDDIPPTQWRLACQMIIRDEDILVEYPSK